MIVSKVLEFKYGHHTVEDEANNNINNSSSPWNLLLDILLIARTVRLTDCA